jgi:hypothetical protein
VIGGQTVIVGLGLTGDGEKVPVGLRLGSTENAVDCTELRQHLLAQVAGLVDLAALVHRRRAYRACNRASSCSGGSSGVPGQRLTLGCYVKVTGTTQRRTASGGP